MRKRTNILHLTLKKKWFDLIASGVKKEEYREIKDYWIRRLNFDIWNTRPFEHIVFRNGYASDAPKLEIELLGIRVGNPNPEWCEPGDADKDVYILSLGDIINKPE